MIVCLLPRKYKRHECDAVVAAELSHVGECAQNTLSGSTLPNCIAALLRLGFSTSHGESRKQAKQDVEHNSHIFFFILEVTDR